MGRPEDLNSPLSVDFILNSITGYAIFVLDTVGTVLTWNSGAERTKGYVHEEIIGRNFSVFYSEADRLAGVPEQALASAAKNGRFETEGWRFRKSGQEFWASISIEPIRDASGQICGFVKVTRDIGERLALQKLKDDIDQTQNSR